MELAPGTILLDKYRIDALIGTGGMGNVVRASHLYLHQPVAIKILLPEMASSESTVQRFLREAQATVKLRSEHSARVIDVGTTPDGSPFMVMEYLDGNDLNQILRHHGPQLPGIVVDLTLQACEGIAEAHALGIIHRDIKPSNFFITRRPDGSMLLKILDFGISKTPVGYDELTGTQTVIGTPSYMAPEQMKSGRSADPRSDIWSIGVVMYQLMTGRLPFSGESYAELVLKVGLEPPAPILVPLPPGLGEVVVRCLEKDPQQRFQSVGDLARVLAPYATDPVLAAQSASRTMRTLQQRSAQFGPQANPYASPLGPAGGLATPIPISPAQLTPRSWSGSNSSLAQAAGQVTHRTRANRGFLIGGIASLCLIAGVGGYAISQLSKSDGRVHVQAPPPKAAEPAGAPTANVPTANVQSSSAQSGSAQHANTQTADSPNTGSAAAPATAAPPPTPPPPTAPPPAASPPMAGSAAVPAAATDPPKADPPKADPPKADPPKAGSAAATDPPKADPPKTDPPKASSHSRRSSKPDKASTPKPDATKPDPKSTSKPDATKPDPTKPDPTKAKPKPSDDLFDTRH